VPNSIGATGLTTKTMTELISYFTAQYQSIYGVTINLDPTSPDGQMMMIYIQAVLDTSDLLTQVYNQFDPDTAVGMVLDQRVAINGIQRQAGTFTVTNVTIVTSQALNLYGLDQVVQPVYTIQDNSGNQWQLISSVYIASASTTILSFQAAKPGAVLTTPNSITVPVTIILGVSSVNNPTTYATLGINAESDVALKLRRQKSVSLSSQGYLSSLLAALQNITGVTSAFVYENTTRVTDADSTPGNTIWVIVAGTASNSAIANAIYTKRNAGCGMRGAQTFNIVQTDGSNFTIRWDLVVPETIFIKFTAASLDGVNVPAYQNIINYIVLNYVPGVNQLVDVNHLTTQIQKADNNTLVTSPGFSSTAGGVYTNTKSNTAKNNQFAISSANIIILPILITPATVAVVRPATQQFASIGGSGTLTYSMFTSGSGAPTVSAAGLYTPGVTAGTDVVRITDALGNISNATITVT
jgi:uncharacterized phage protein gp47/JayE